MKIYHHRLNLPLQSGLLVLLSVILGLLLTREFWFCSIFLFLMILLLVAGIDRQQRKATEGLKKLIAAIRFSDFSLSFSKGGKKGIDPTLATAMAKTLAHFHKKIVGLEEQHQYYNTLLSTIDSGLLVVNHEKEVEWYNKAVLREFNLKKLNRLSDLQAILTELPDILLQLQPGEIRVIRLEQEGQIREIAFNSILFRIKNKELQLISLKNIHPVLENNEIEAWQKLIRVLTHEIMNSLAPIISLSETLMERNTESHPGDLAPTVTQQALQAIHRRSKGLLEFVQNYRKLTRIPAPEFSILPIPELFSGLQKLHHSPCIRYSFICPDPHLQLLADRTQIEQVLINLIRNAEEACTEIPDPRITVSASIVSHQLIISIRDNGPGIIPEAIDKIFVPFFTTKPGGSGIGLSLCKQIMTLHHGNITVHSKPGQGCTFLLLFSK